MTIRAVVARRLGRTPELRRMGVNARWLAWDQLVRMAVSLAVGVLLARYLGPTGLGAYSYALAFVALAGSFVGLGLDGIVVREATLDPANRDALLGSAFVLKLLGGLASWVVAAAAIQVIAPGDEQAQLLVTIIAAAGLFQAFDTIAFWFQSRQDSRHIAWARTGAALLGAAGRVALIRAGAGLPAFAWLYVAEGALVGIGLILAYRAAGYRLLAWSPGLARARGMLADSWPLILSGVVTIIYMRIDQVMLKAMVDEREVGLYSTAVRLAEVWYFIPMVLVSAAFPPLVVARRDDEERFFRGLQRLYNLMALLGYAVAIPVTFLSGIVVSLLFGEAYREAGPMLAVLIWTTLFVNLGVARTSFLTAMNWTRLHFYMALLGGVVNVALNLVLIPRYGGLGAAVSTCIAYAVAAYLSCFVYPPLFRTGGMLTRALFLPNPS